MNTNDMQNAFKDDLINKQAQLIQKLEKTNKELKEKVDHLESMMVGNGALAISTENSIPNEIVICEQQIAQLHAISASGANLTQEQAKKLEIYVKILNNWKDGTKKEQKDTELNSLSTDELKNALKIVPSK